MPLMKGPAPIRRTLKYLEGGKLHFKPKYQILTVNYNINQKSSVGAYEFQFWNFPQIKFKNPSMQLLKFKNMTPSPYISLYEASGNADVIDCYGRTKDEIENHLLELYCLPEHEIKAIRDPGSLKVRKERKPWNEAAFGLRCRHFCICEIPGQVPCPAYTPIPYELTGKYRKKKREEEQDEAR